MRLLLTCILAGVLAQGSPLSQQKAQVFREKIAAVLARGEAAPARPVAPARTVLAEDEINSYFQFHAADVAPEGVAEPRVSLGAAGHVVGRAIVDLDAVRRTRSTGGWFDPRSYLTGRLPVVVSGTVMGEKGQARFALERAEVSGVPVPKSVLQELVSYYTRSELFPDGVDLDAPFPMPARIERLIVQRGEAVVVQ
ncbi:MAG: hypothetical protein AB7O67_14120 [Vicinamibacterales bacterium]